MILWNRSLVSFAMSVILCIVSESLSFGEDIQPIFASYHSSPVDESVAVYSCVDSCQYSGIGDQRYLINARVGTSYYSVPGESLFGAAYGLDFAYQLTDDWGFVASGNFNSVSEGTQFVGSLGTLKLPDLSGCEWHDRYSFAFFFDQFTDSRVDTFDGALYLNAIRLQLGYAVSESLEIGTIYSKSTHDDDDVMFRFVSFPGSLPVPGVVGMSDSISCYAAGKFRDIQLASSIGYRDSPGTLTLSETLRKPVSDSLALYSNANYEARKGNWGLGIGVEFSFGASKQETSCCLAGVHRSPPGQHAVIRAQSPDSNILLVNVPSQNQFDAPDNTAGNFPRLLGDVPSQTSTPNPYNYPEFNNNTSWTRRYQDSNSRSLMILTPADVMSGLNANGLANLIQDGIQSPFTRFAIQGKGGRLLRKDARRRD